VAPALCAAALLAAAGTLPALWWEPLHVDEAITLEFAPRNVPQLLDDIFVERGGSPAFFLVEHVTLQWPGGIEGLRLPSVLFFLLALAAASLVAGELCSPREAVLLPLLLALAPLAVGLATFARMYTLFLALLLLVVWMLLLVARSGTRLRWIGAGAAAGLLVYVHPTAPLYVALALATAYLCSGRPLRGFLADAWPGLAALALAALPYGYALAVLTRRYEVASSGSSLLEGSGGRPVPVEALHALTPGGWAGALVFLALAVAGEVALLRRDRARGIAVVLWLVVPVAFFSLVPADTGFFARYVLPVAPFFLLLVAAGCLLLGRLTPAPLLTGLLLVAGLGVWQASEVVSRLGHLRELELRETVGAVDRLEPGVVFSSTGGLVAGRPAELVDLYVCLEVPDAVCVEELPAVEPRFEPDIVELGAAEVRAFLAGGTPPARGAWVFAGPTRRVLLGERRLREGEGIAVERLSPRLLLVHTDASERRHELVEQGIAVRQAWLGRAGRDRWARALIAVDRSALAESG
jgi:Dolichyl-phosphate-mannose-protein mannosyltransferase